MKIVTPVFALVLFIVSTISFIISQQNSKVAAIDIPMPEPLEHPSVLDELRRNAFDGEREARKRGEHQQHEDGALNVGKGPRFPGRGLRRRASKSASAPGESNDDDDDDDLRSQSSNMNSAYPPHEQAQDEKVILEGDPASTNQNLGFQSPILAEQTFCVEDSLLLCPKESPKTFDSSHSSAGVDENGNPIKKSGRVMTITECLELHVDQIRSLQCKNFIQGRRQCFNDMDSIDLCADFRTSVEITDRYNMRRHKLDSRKARLGLRNMLRGKSTSSASRSLSKSESAEQNTNNDENSLPSSPSMSMSQDLSGDDADMKQERMLQKLEEKYEQDKKEVNLSSRRTDYFMSMCAATIARSAADAAKDHLVSEQCSESIAFSHLPFGDEKFVRLAKRKALMHRRNVKRFSDANQKHNKLLENLKERTIRHDLDKMDADLESGRQSEEDLAQTMGKDERGRFLLRERKNRALRRREHLHKQHQKFGKDLESHQHGETHADVLEKYSKSQSAKKKRMSSSSSSKSKKMATEEDITQ